MSRRRERALLSQIMRGALVVAFAILARGMGVLTNGLVKVSRRGVKRHLLADDVNFKG